MLRASPWILPHVYPTSPKLVDKTVRVLHNSPFSSMEISGFGSASTISSIPTRASGENATVNQSTGNGLSDSTAVASVMSFTGILDPTDTSKLPTLRQTFEPTHDNASGPNRKTGDNGVSNILMKDPPEDVSTRKRSTTTCLDDPEVLSAKVSEMNLKGLVHPPASVVVSKH